MDDAPEAAAAPVAGSDGGELSDEARASAHLRKLDGARAKAARSAPASSLLERYAELRACGLACERW